MATLARRRRSPRPASETTPYTTVDRAFRADQAARSLAGRIEYERSEPARRPERHREIDPVRNHTTEYNDDPYNSMVTYGPPLPSVAKGKPKKRRTPIQKLWDRTRATAVAPWLLAWAGFWYTTFQLPFAIISTAGLGMAAVVYAAITATLGEGVTKFLAENAPLAFSTFAQAVAFVAGSEFQLTFDPMLLFLIPFVSVMMLGLMNLLVIWFAFSIAGLNPLSGRAATAKICLFLLALVGIAIPILNLFPFTALWCLMVWWKPK